MKPLASNTVVGWVRINYARAPDGSGGFYLEPQGRAPVLLSDLDVEVQALLRGVWA